jgi:predicted dienelactone hydrolase
MFCRQSLFAFAVLSCAVPSRADEPTAYKLADGPFTVQTADDITIQDKERNQELHVKVHYPKGDGHFPVIVFSHGFGAGKDAFAPIGKHWASHGYVSIHPQHADGGSLDRLRTRKADGPTEEAIGDARAGAGADRAKLRERLAQRGFQRSGGSPDQIANRVRDVSAVIDGLDQVAETIPALKGKLDREQIGVSGHSYGACVSMLLAGATIDVAGEPKSFADARVKCVLPIAAAGTGEYGLTKESWKACNRPAFYITGTKDIRPGHQFSWRKEPFELSPNGDKYLLIVDGANHVSFGGGPSGATRLRAGIGGSTVAVATNFVKTSSTAFFDACLKGDKQAQAFLAEGLVKYAGKQATLSSK